MFQFEIGKCKTRDLFLWPDIQCIPYLLTCTPLNYPNVGTYCILSVHKRLALEIQGCYFVESNQELKSWNVRIDFAVDESHEMPWKRRRFTDVEAAMENQFKQTYMHGTGMVANHLPEIV